MSSHRVSEQLKSTDWSSFLNEKLKRNKIKFESKESLGTIGRKTLWVVLIYTRTKN